MPIKRLKTAVRKLASKIRQGQKYGLVIKNNGVYEAFTFILPAEEKIPDLQPTDKHVQIIEICRIPQKLTRTQLRNRIRALNQLNKLRGSK